MAPPTKPVTSPQSKILPDDEFVRQATFSSVGPTCTSSSDLSRCFNNPFEPKCLDYFAREEQVSKVLSSVTKSRDEAIEKIYWGRPNTILSVEMSKLNDGRLSLSAALAENPQHADLYYERGLIEYDMSIYNREINLLPEAIADLEKAVALEPGNREYKNRLGWAHFLAGDFHQALEVADQLIQSKPFRLNDSYQDNYGIPLGLEMGIFELRAEALEKLGRFDEALRAWTLVTGSERGWYGERLRKAELELRMGRNLEAGHDFFEARKYDDLEGYFTSSSWLVEPVSSFRLLTGLKNALLGLSRGTAFAACFGPMLEAQVENVVFTVGPIWAREDVIIGTAGQRWARETGIYDASAGPLLSSIRFCLGENY